MLLQKVSVTVLRGHVTVLLQGGEVPKSVRAVGSQGVPGGGKGQLRLNMLGGRSRQKHMTSTHLPLWLGGPFPARRWDRLVPLGKNR